MEQRPMVEIKVKGRRDHTLYYKVSVRSVMKPSSIMEGILEYKEHSNECRAIQILAAALAEEICERLHDRFLDPDLVANEAGKLYRQLIASDPEITLGDDAPRAADKFIGVVPN